MEEGKSGGVPLIENVLAPEVFAVEASSFMAGAGFVSVTLTSFRYDNTTPPGEQKKVVIGRLVMPVVGAHGLATGLFDFLVRSGLVPAPPRQERSRQVQ